MIRSPPASAAIALPALLLMRGRPQGAILGGCGVTTTD